MHALRKMGFPNLTNLAGGVNAVPASLQRGDVQRDA